MTARYTPTVIYVEPDSAVAAGATPVPPPEDKPWGQVVGYVRDLDGVLVEISGSKPSRSCAG